jgi:hypothetical protein
MAFLADHEEDATVMIGRLKGGQDFIDHIATKGNGSRPGH